MKLLKKHILGILSSWTLVLINFNPKLTFVQSIFSLIDMTPSTPEMRKIKTGVSKVKVRIWHDTLIRWILNFFLGDQALISISTILKFSAPEQTRAINEITSVFNAFVEQLLKPRWRTNKQSTIIMKRSGLSNAIAPSKLIVK